LTVSSDVLRNHIDYTIWATGRLLNVATTIPAEQLAHDFGTADKSVAGTLVHIFRAERSWLGRIQHGTPLVPWGLAEDEQWAVLIEQWPALHQAWQEWAATLSDADADRVIDYTDLKGRPWSQPLWPIVLHVVNHSTHHRGQISGFLRALGLTPPPLDFIAFVRERAD
jgi:uncharacterized damage-inducible protein DinB